MMESWAANLNVHDDGEAAPEWVEIIESMTRFALLCAARHCRDLMVVITKGIALGILKREERRLVDADSNGDDKSLRAVRDTYSVVSGAPPTFIALGILPQRNPELAGVQVFQEPGALAPVLHEDLPIEALLAITESDVAARRSTSE